MEIIAMRFGHAEVFEVELAVVFGVVLEVVAATSAVADESVSVILPRVPMPRATPQMSTSNTCIKSGRNSATYGTIGVDTYYVVSYYHLTTRSGHTKNQGGLHGRYNQLER